MPKYLLNCSVHISWNELLVLTQVGVSSSLEDEGVSSPLYLKVIWRPAASADDAGVHKVRRCIVDLEKFGPVLNNCEICQRKCTIQE